MNEDEGACRPLTEEEMEEMRTLLHAKLRRQAEREARPYDTPWEHLRAISECYGKSAFLTYHLAASTISPRLRHQVNPYRCQTCGKFHIGNVQHTRKKRLARAKTKERQ